MRAEHTHDGKVVAAERGYWKVEASHPHSPFFLTNEEVAPALRRVGAEGELTYQTGPSYGRWVLLEKKR